METSNLTLPQGTETGKYRFSFFFHHRQGGDGSLKSTDTEASEELLQRTAKQQILTSGCSRDFYCNGTLSLWVHCKDDMLTMYVQLLSHRLRFFVFNSVSFFASLFLPPSYLSGFTSYVTFSVCNIFSSSVCILCQQRIFFPDISPQNNIGNHLDVSGSCQLRWIS